MNTKAIQQIRALFQEIYGSLDGFDDLLTVLQKASKCSYRTKKKNWYRDNNIVAMMLYPQLFAKNLSGLKTNLDYLSELGVNFLHLMPIFKMPKERNDGGYAVSDFMQVDARVGNNKQLLALIDACNQQGMDICLDIVLNHTADDHPWAMKAKAGEADYQNYYHVFQDDTIPKQYEQTLPQVFPETEPGNFTYVAEMNQYVMTTFHSYQWDLNYANPKVLCEMLSILFHYAAMGVCAFRLDALPYIWKELGTNCRNHPTVHKLSRLIRMICETICPSVVLLGEVVMEPKYVLPYFGTDEEPECHLLYNVITMASIWNSLATRDTRLLQEQIGILANLPSNNTYVNYLRCHDDIGWGLNEATLRSMGSDPVEHKKFLYTFFEGSYPGSFSMGKLYNYDPNTSDARTCGTLASLCGLEKAFVTDDEVMFVMSMKRIELLHKLLFTLPGIPMLYSGDEIGQLNDYSYLKSPDKQDDSRYLHRGSFSFADANKRKEASYQRRIFESIRTMLALRSKGLKLANANITVNHGEDVSILSFNVQDSKKNLRYYFNFSEHYKTLQDGTEMKPYEVLTREDPHV